MESIKRNLKSQIFSLFILLLLNCDRNSIADYELNYKGYAILYFTEGTYCYFLPTNYENLFRNNYSIIALAESNSDTYLIGVRLSEIKRNKIKKTTEIPYYYSNFLDSILITNDKYSNSQYRVGPLHVYRVYIEIKNAGSYDNFDLQLSRRKKKLSVFEIYNYKDGGGIKKLEIIEEIHIGEAFKRKSVMEVDSDYVNQPILR